MDILLVLNFNVKQLGDKHLLKLLDNKKFFDKLKASLKVFVKHKDLEGIEICLITFSNVFANKKAVQYAQKRHGIYSLIKEIYEVSGLSSEINLACIDVFEKLQSSGVLSITKALNNAAKSYSVAHESLCDLPYRLLVDNEKERDMSDEAIYSRIHLFDSIIREGEDAEE